MVFKKYIYKLISTNTIFSVWTFLVRPPEVWSCCFFSSGWKILLVPQYFKLVFMKKKGQNTNGWTITFNNLCRDDSSYQALTKGYETSAILV